MSPGWKLRTSSLRLERGVIMGVVNVTPDSFSDGGVNLDPEDAIATGLEMASAGAALIDVGGESTRPGSEPVSAEEETRRILPVVEGLVAAGIPVSIDTSKPEVAQAALAAGAEAVNDVTACAAEGMIQLVADSGAGVVLMHSQGPPKTMQINPSYEDVVTEVASFLASRARELEQAGVESTAIAVDPGIGFGKTVAHNLELIDGLGRIVAGGYPVVLGASRKSFLGAVTGIEEPARRDGATVVTTALGFERGARVFRVHDVESTRVALSIAAAIVAPQQWDEWSPDSNHVDSPG